MLKSTNLFTGIDSDFNDINNVQLLLKQFLLSYSVRRTLNPPLAC